MAAKGYCRLCAKVTDAEHKRLIEQTYYNVGKQEAIDQARQWGYDISRASLDTHAQHTVRDIARTSETGLAIPTKNDVVSMSSDVTTMAGSEDEQIRTTLETIIQIGIENIRNRVASVTTPHVLQALEQYSARYGKQNTDRIDQLAALLRGNVEEVTLKMKDSSHANNTLESLCANAPSGDGRIDNGTGGDDSFSL